MLRSGLSGQSQGHGSEVLVVSRWGGARTNWGFLTQHRENCRPEPPSLVLCLPTSLRADNRPYCSGNTARLVDTASTWPDPLPETGKGQLVSSPLQSFSLNKSPPRLCPDCVQRPADPAFPPRPLPWLTLLPTLALLGLLMVGVPHCSSLQRISFKLPETQRGLLVPPSTTLSSSGATASCDHVHPHSQGPRPLGSSHVQLVAARLAVTVWACPLGHGGL